MFIIYFQGYSDHKTKHFNHTQIHRGICVTRTCKNFTRIPNLNETQDLREALEGCLNHSIYSQYGLEGEVAIIQYCNKEGDVVQIDTSDIIMAVVYLVLIALNVVGSLYDVLLSKEEDNNKKGNN